MLYPSEVAAIVQLKLSSPLFKRGNEGPDLKRCYQLLKLTSRSFASVIEQLNPELRDAVMIFYLVLRGLDTIEDDTGLDNKIKLPLLRSFRDVLKSKDWTFHESSPTEKDRVVLQEFDVILREYHKLRHEYMDIIADITHKMGNGMADYIGMESQKNYEGVLTIKDYDLYCHHVAGIVGEGLTRMAIVAKFVTRKIAESDELYESMGLFLQKTNIIRDYREDIDDGRSFWPKEVWSKYTTDLRNFTKPEFEDAGLFCVSNLVILSLNHVIDCLEYLANLSEPSYFKFCAIPQVMSIATLELVFNNPKIFHENVKIRKGLAAELILRADGITEVYAIFRNYVRRIHKRNRIADPNFFQIEMACGRIEQYLNAHDRRSPQYQAAHTPPGPYDDPVSSALLVASVVGSALLAFGIMIAIGNYAGAEFTTIDRFKEEYRTFWKFMTS